MAKNIRVHELAKELGMTNAEMMALCEQMGVGVKTHSSTLIEQWADQLRRKAEREGLTRPEQPEDGMVRSEMEEQIQRAVSQLPAEQRLVFTMSEIEGMKYQDIAEALDIPLGTVKSRMHTAFQRLRDLLRDIAPWTGGGAPPAGAATSGGSVNDEDDESDRDGGDGAILTA